MNLDGFDLPIKELKGTNPVNSLDFSEKGLGPASAIVIAALISDNASQVPASLTCLDLSVGSYYHGRVNGIGPDGGLALAEALQSNTTLQELRLWGNDIGPEAAKLMSRWIAVSSSVTSVRAFRNS